MQSQVEDYDEAIMWLKVRQGSVGRRDLKEKRHIQLMVKNINCGSGQEGRMRRS